MELLHSVPMRHFAISGPISPNQRTFVAHPQLSRDEKLAILREWEQDALRLSTSESEGMGGGEESMLGRVEESIGILERSPR